MSTKQYAVIVPHYNDVARLNACLGSLFIGAEPNSLDNVEVVVVDNGSTQSLEDTKRAFPEVRFVNEAQKGAAAARNRGVRETTAPTLFFLDADCIAMPDWLNSAKRSIKTEGAEIIGGRIYTFDETPPPRSGAEAFEAVFAFNQRRYIEEKEFSVTANLLTTRAVFEDTGNFIVGVSEDVDWCWRSQKKGYRLRYDDKVAVRHPTRQDWPALQKKWRRLTEEGFLLNGSGVVARIKWALRAFAILASSVIHAPKIIFSSNLTNARERWLGILTLFRLRIWRCIHMLRQAVGL